MRTKTLLSILALCFIGLNSLSAQGFTKPSEGKAAVYFTRTVMYGSKMLIDIFDREQYVAYSIGKGYSVYECNPGEHVFWIAGENTDFITADLEAGKVYIAQVYVYPGVMKGRVNLVPNSAIDKKIDGYNASLEIIKAVKPKVMDEKKFQARMKKFVSKKFMTVKMEGYKKNIEGKDIPRITKEMAVEQKELK
ncbi:MAG: hypothetical protein NTV01_02710 [Bacteroidia bacterium]|nr:hypothetical protein [Bacteroidia bacterium]